MPKAVALVLVLVAIAGAQSVAPGQQAAVPLEEAAVAQLQAWMRGGRYTSRQLTDAYLDRIEAVDRHGPTLREIIELNQDARSDADALDRERREKGARGPLHGIPILIKDNIDTGD